MTSLLVLLAVRNVMTSKHDVTFGALLFSSIMNALRSRDAVMPYIIYGSTCTECGKVVYVGETGRQLKERVEKHLRDIRLNRDKSVVTHFNSSTHPMDNVQVPIL